MSQSKEYLKSKDKKKARFNQYPIKEEVLSLLNVNNFRQPTLVQAESLPITLQEKLRDLCVIIYAYNGAGKTLSYLIPILNSLEMIPDRGIDNGLRNKVKEINRPQALIILPTEALMSQVYEYLQAYADFYEVQYKWKMNIGLQYGGMQTSGHIIVGLTKIMAKFIGNTIVNDFSELKWVVFDECDKIKNDLEEDFKGILKSFSSNDKVSSANFLITSATGEKKAFREFIQNNLVSHNVLELDSKDENKGLVGVKHYFSMVNSVKQKEAMIFGILEKLAKLEAKPQVIIFFNKREELVRFYNLLRAEKDLFVVNDSQADSKNKNNLEVDYIHSRCGICKGPHNCPEDCSSTKTKRVDRLRNQEIQVLLGTETIGRGIDIRSVSLVINYSEPKNAEEYSPSAYIHRVGRTGRYTDEGIALTFVDSNVFVELTENDQKIVFESIKSQQRVVDEMLQCSKKNEKINDENGQLRYKQ